MKRTLMVLAPVLTFCSGVAIAINVRQTPATGGYLIERDGQVAQNEPGPHDGGGPSTGYKFFEKAENLKFSFRKRVLHKGAAIGYTCKRRTRFITSRAAAAS